jgi:hypothetical protein
MERQRQANELLPLLIEQMFRVQRSVVLAPEMGPVANDAAAGQLVERVAALTSTRKGNLVELRQCIDSFNLAAREAHSEMLASLTRRQSRLSE